MSYEGDSGQSNQGNKSASEKLDEFQQEATEDSLEDEGLLPLPKAEPADGPAPAA